MKNRVLLVLPLLLAGGLVTSASAAPKVCKIIKDPTGDAAVGVLTDGPGAPGSANEDIVSGDLASDGKTLTAVIRLAALTQPDPQAPLGQSYLMEFGAKGAANLLFLTARLYPQGAQFVYGYSGEDPNLPLNTSYTLGTAKGVVDPAKKEVRISVPTSAFKSQGAKLAKGTKITTPVAKAYRIAGQGFVPSQSVGPARVPVGGLNVLVDDASGASYTIGVASCVKPGA